jgi:hypothetical protein
MIKHSELEILAKSPFANCKLDREKYAQVLTNIINSYSYGFVLAINNKWGTGKTTFVKMWEQDLKNKEYQTVYFNAWENDFENNPLTALMGELKTLTTKSTETEFKSTLKKAVTLTKHIAPIVAKAIADKYIDTANIKDAIVGVTKGLTDVFENDVNEYSKKKKSISEFRTSLSEFIANTNKGKPVIFIIDELDRCRPDYAVSILEQVKHFFSVPNIIFILSIDKIQLGNAVRGVYGSDKIDADEYLRRFIDLEYSIPEPETGTFSAYLYEYFNFDDFFAKPERAKYSELKFDKTDFLKIARIIFSNSNTSLREQEKIFALAKISLRAFAENYFVFPFVYLFLTYVKIKKTNLYNNIKLKNLTIEQLQDSLFEIVGNKINEDNERELIVLEAYLLNFYNNSLNSDYYHKSKLYEKDEEGNNKLLINSIINKAKNIDLLHFLESIERRRSGGDLKIEYFLNKIELLEELKL